MTTLIDSATATNSSATEGNVKTFLVNLRDFVAGFLGTDTSNKGAALQALGSPLNATSVKSAAFTVTSADRGKVFACTGTFTVNVVAAATLGDGFSFGLWNTSTGVITIDPNLAEQVDGKTTRVIRAGKMVMIYCDGTKFVTVGASELEEFSAGQSADLPRIRGEALADIDYVSVMTVSASSDFLLTNGVTDTPGAASTTSTSDVVARTFLVEKYAGTVRINAQHYIENVIGSGTSYLSIYVNSTLVASWSTVSTTAVARTADIAVSAGDTVQIRHRAGGASGARSYSNSGSIYADNAWINYGAIGKAVP